MDRVPEKLSWKPGTMIYPLPAVMVSCGASPEEYNIVTVAWTGTVCTEPPMCYISLRPERLSHGVISRTGEFVINLTTRSLARATDWCGVRSGRDHDNCGTRGAGSGHSRGPGVDRVPCARGAASRLARHVCGRCGECVDRRALCRQ